MMVGGAAAILDAFMTAIATSAKGPEASKFGPRNAVKDGGGASIIDNILNLRLTKKYPGKLVRQHRPGNILLAPIPANRQPRRPLLRGHRSSQSPMIAKAFGGNRHAHRPSPQQFPFPACAVVARGIGRAL